MVPNFTSHEYPALGLTVKIVALDFDSPNSIEQMETVLADHVIHCRHCLAMVFCRAEDLSETGCGRYQNLLSKMRSLLKLHKGSRKDVHISNEMLEEYCFARLDDEDRETIEQHLEVCPACLRNLNDRLAFIACMKSALQELAERSSPEPGTEAPGC